MGIQKKETKKLKKESSEPEYYSVESILDSKQTAAGEKLYFVKWEGYDETTWEPYENLKNVKSLVEEYEQAKERKQTAKENRDKEKNKSELHEQDKKKQHSKHDSKQATKNEESTISPAKKIKKITKEIAHKKSTKELPSKNSKDLIIVEKQQAQDTKNQFTKSDPIPPTSNLASSAILEKAPRIDALIKYSTKNSEIKERCDSEKLQQLFNAKSIVSSQQQGSLQHNVVDKILNHCRGVENEWLYLVSWVQLPHSPSVLTPSYISSQTLQLKYHDKIINYLESIQLS